MTRSGRIRLNLLLALICVPIFIGALDLTVVSAVLPHVIVDLGIPLQGGLDNAAWLVTGYLLAYSISIVFMGRLSDLSSRRTVYLVALGIFALGSFMVASASHWLTPLVLRGYYLVVSGRPDISYVTLDILIVSRMVQAFGAGTMVPVGMALVGDLFPMAARTRPLGIIAAVDTAGWVVGHLYGGIVVRYFDWRVIFWLNLPVCLAAFLLIWYMLRGVKQERSLGKMDWAGVLLATAGLSLLILGFGGNTDAGTTTSMQTQTTLSTFKWPLLLGSAVFFGLFIWRQRTAEHPLVDLTLFRLQNFLPASLANFLVGFSLFIAIANVPIFINTLVAPTLEQGAWDSGWMLSALTVPIALASIPGAWLSDKRGYRFAAATGSVLAVAGFFLMSGWKADTAYAAMVPQLILCGIGIGLTMAPLATAVVNTSPPDKRGTSSSLVILFRLVGMTIGVSIITTFDIQRTRLLSDQMLSATASLNETVQVGMRVVERVISETFILAGIVAVLAFVSILFLRNQDHRKEVENV